LSLISNSVKKSSPWLYKNNGLTKRPDVFISPLGVRHYPGAGLKELKIRIATIRSITKVTNSMKMIASAKLTKQQERLGDARPYRISSIAFLDHQYPQLDKKDEFYKEKKAQEESEEVDEVVLCITSDRGLCGGVNSNVSREMLRLMKLKHHASLIVIGDKAIQQLQKELSSKFVLTVSGVSGNKPITFHEILLVTDLILANPFQKLTIVFNYFNNIVQYSVTGHKFPGLEKVLEDERRHQPFQISEGNHDIVLRSAYQYSLASFLFGAVTECQTCEIAGRMTAMENATKNGNDLIKVLTMQYNKVRQQAITTELIEIVGGASAVDEQNKAAKKR